MPFNKLAHWPSQQRDETVDAGPGDGNVGLLVVRVFALEFPHQLAAVSHKIKLITVATAAGRFKVEVHANIGE